MIRTVLVLSWLPSKSDVTVAIRSKLTMPPPKSVYFLDDAIGFSATDVWLYGLRIQSPSIVLRVVLQFSATKVLN